MAIDAFFPVVPGDAATITAAIVAAEADLSIVLVVAAGLPRSHGERQLLLPPGTQARESGRAPAVSQR
ncbi:MAG: hypothetical protein H0U12_07600 [Thermoleophilaceae bacterium]|nr:hypothetical protein [Thermoleophilaceae bacterium]